MKIVDIARQPGLRYSPYLLARILVGALEPGEWDYCVQRRRYFHSETNILATRSREVFGVSGVTIVVTDILHITLYFPFGELFSSRFFRFL